MKLKTKTLTDREKNPTVVICPGHIEARKFNSAFKNEGWKGTSDYKQSEIRYEYWKVAAGGKRFYRTVPGRFGAKPYTVTSWDHS